MDLSLSIRVEHEGTVVRVAGDLDSGTARELRERLTDLIRRGHYDLILDLEAVSFLDSTGLAVLVNALKRTRGHDGSLRVVCTNEPIIQIFRITGLTKAFTIHRTTAAALAAVELREPPPGLWAKPPPSIAPGSGAQGRHAQR